MRPVEPTQLYDDVHAWTFGKPSEANIAIEPRNSNAIAATTMRIYRSQIKAAQRFYLDDDFVEAALEASRDLDRLQYWVNLARLPYEHVWLEFDQHAKVMSSWRQGHFELENGPVPQPNNLDEIPERLGFLMNQANADTGLWSATSFAPAKKGKLTQEKITVVPVTWVLSPEGDATLPLRSEPIPIYHQLHAVFPAREGDAVNNLFRFARAFGIGAMVANQDGSNKRLAQLPWVVDRLAACMEPLHACAMADYQKIHSKDAWSRAHAAIADHVAYVLTEDRGIMRFLIVVLAMLNQAPNVRRVPVNSGGHRVTRGRKLDYLGHSLVTLELPKRKNYTYLTQLNRELDYAAAERRRNRAHRVRGHFRQVERGKGPLAYSCSHIATLVENGLGICARCERLIRWVPNHVRGDAELGWVLHDYEVTTS